MIDIPTRDTQADKEFSKLTFKLSKHKLKKLRNSTKLLNFLRYTKQSMGIYKIFKKKNET